MFGERPLMPHELEDLDPDFLDSLFAKRRAEAEYLRMEREKASRG